MSSNKTPWRVKFSVKMLIIIDKSRQSDNFSLGVLEFSVFREQSPKAIYLTSNRPLKEKKTSRMISNSMFAIVAEDDESFKIEFEHDTWHFKCYDRQTSSEVQHLLQTVRTNSSDLYTVLPVRPNPSLSSTENPNAASQRSLGQTSARIPNNTNKPQQQQNLNYNFPNNKSNNNNISNNNNSNNNNKRKAEPLINTNEPLSKKQREGTLDLVQPSKPTDKSKIPQWTNENSKSSVYFDSKAPVVVSSSTDRDQKTGVGFGKENTKPIVIYGRNNTNQLLGSPKKHMISPYTSSSYSPSQTGRSTSSSILSSPSSSYPTFSRPGLVNQGNNCYINAILQSLVSLRVFVNDLRETKHLPTPKNSFNRSFLEFLDRSDLPGKNAINPQAIKNAVARHSERFDNSRQQDAHEFLCEILALLEDELKAARKREKDLKSGKKIDLTDIENESEIESTTTTKTTEKPKSKPKLFLIDDDDEEEETNTNTTNTKNTNTTKPKTHYTDEDILNYDIQNGGKKKIDKIDLISEDSQETQPDENIEMKDAIVEVKDEENKKEKENHKKETENENENTKQQHQTKKQENGHTTTTNSTIKHEKEEEKNSKSHKNNETKQIKTENSDVKMTEQNENEENEKQKETEQKQKEIEEKQKENAQADPLLDTNFNLYLSVKLTCLQCGDISRVSELYRDFSLEVTSNQLSHPSIDDLLCDFSAPINVDRACEKCKHPKAERTNKIISLPRIFVVHLKRFAFNWDKEKNVVEVKKLQSPVRVQHEIDIGAYCSADVHDPDSFDWTEEYNSFLKTKSHQNTSTTSNSTSSSTTSHMFPISSKIISLGNAQTSQSNPKNNNNNTTNERTNPNPPKPSAASRIFGGVQSSINAASETMHTLFDSVLTNGHNNVKTTNNTNVKTNTNSNVTTKTKTSNQNDSDDDNPFSFEKDVKTRQSALTTPTTTSTTNSKSSNVEHFDLNDDDPDIKKALEESKRMAEKEEEKRKQKEKEKEQEKEKEKNEIQFSDDEKDKSKEDDDYERAIKESAKSHEEEVKKRNEEEAEQKEMEEMRKKHGKELDDTLLKEYFMESEKMSDIKAMQKVNGLESDMREAMIESISEEKRKKILRERDSESTRKIYHLQAVVRHLGKSAHSGHYVADVFHPFENVWRTYNDQSVSKVDSQTFLGSISQEAYVLFYVFDNNWWKKENNKTTTTATTKQK